MGTPLFILLASVAIALIALAIDIPTAKWEGFRARPRPKRTLLSILEQLTIQDAEEDRDETLIQAKTYTEAVKRMQDREKSRLDRLTSGGDPT